MNSIKYEVGKSYLRLDLIKQTLITSKPTSGTLTSFSVFLIISFVLIGMSLIQVTGDVSPPWYSYLAIGVLSPIALAVVIKIFINYKVIRLGNNQITVDYPIKKAQHAYSLKDVVHWRESLVKTGKKSTFKELEILFADKRKVRLAHKEYTHYPEILAYLDRKLSAKKVSEA